MKTHRSYRKSTIPEGAQCVFEGVLFDVYQWEQDLYDGTKTTFEKLVRRDGAVVLPIRADGKLVLINDEQPGRAPVLRAVGGSVEDGETPDEAIVRELKEELGYTASSILKIAERKPEDKLDWMVYSFVAYGCKQTEAPNPGSGERVTPHYYTFDEFIELGRSGALHSEWRLRILEAALDETKMRALRTLLQNP